MCACVCVCVCVWYMVCVCGGGGGGGGGGGVVCVCVCVKKVTSNSCVVDTRLKIVAVNSSALQAVEWCNPSTSCYV